MGSFLALDSEEIVRSQTGRPGWGKLNKTKRETEALVCWAARKTGRSEERRMKSEC